MRLFYIRDTLRDALIVARMGFFLGRCEFACAALLTFHRASAGQAETKFPLDKEQSDKAIRNGRTPTPQSLA